MNEQETNPETTSSEVPETTEVETTPEVTAEPETVTEAAGLEAAPEEEPAEIPAEKTAPVFEPAEDSKAAPAAKATAMAWAHKAKRFLMAYKYTIVAVVLVLIGLLGFTYMLEQEGRIHTGMFDAVHRLVAAHKAVATVNNQKITQKDLDVSVSQLQMGATAQGVDTSDPKMQEQIRTQALDMLVNTELLKQEAAARGINITAEDVDARLESLKTEIGGEDVLNERMEQFGVDQKTLRRDIQNELTIQALLDQVFAEKGITVSDEEIAEFYEQAGGEKGGLPKLEEVKDQIEAQIKSTKEQETVSSYLEELKAKATIEMM